MPASYVVYEVGDGTRKAVRTNDPATIASNLKSRGLTVVKTVKEPSLKSLEKYSDNGVCPTPDGCRVEPDGKCQHNLSSWLLILGII